ncbi:SafA/ExsA family spore coat assembly protein [Bacillus sp. CECT 9360]|uniref:SafA/ExsA family spore coat assembly protein n=1 Tax=Bacillus sp. CECT 9360 TaxID=2845821 RepID=UPI001E46FAAB|nr:SafA/ExsA family spore coat assembly protein [Bacillus sp. CECT 9360]CAH0346370.1 hypothetical protein BCI9360_02701 [Bacillus sp. CECT 9360]
MKIHIVQKGDTLWKLSKKYGVSFEELKKANTQLSNPDMIMPGMKIKVPGSSGSVKKETVKPSVKEAPTQYTQPVKEQPMVAQPPIPQPFVQQPIVKEQPKPQPYIQQPMVKEQPKPQPYIQQPMVKEQPKPQPFIQPKEEPFPKQIVKEQPVMPEIDMEIDINNYYMVNMVKPPVPKMVEPKVMKEESPEVEYAPAPDCVPVTPIMPGTGFCLPYQPWAIPQMQQSFPQVQEWESCSDTSEMQYMQQQGYGTGFNPYRQERMANHQYDSSSFDQAGYGQLYGNSPAMGGSYAPEVPSYESSMESPANLMSTYNQHHQYPKFQPQYQQPEYQQYPEIQPQYQQYPESKEYPKFQPQYQQPEYEQYPESKEYPKFQPQYQQPESEQYPKFQPQYQQPEYEQYPEVQPQYQQYPESKEYPKFQPQYQQLESEQYPKFQPQYQQPEYQQYPEVQPQYQQPEYEQYPGVQLQYQQYPESQQYPEVQLQYQQYQQMQPLYSYPQQVPLPGMPGSKDCGCGGGSRSDIHQLYQYQQPMPMRFPQPEPEHNQGSEFHSVIDPYKPDVFKMPEFADESSGL